MTDGPHLTPEGISAAAEGLLSDADQRAAREHLASCERCQSAEDQLADLRATLRWAGTQTPRMPEQVADRLQSALAAESAERGKRNGVLSLGSAAGKSRRSKHAAPSKARRRLGPALAAAAGVAAIAVGGTVGYQVFMDGQTVTGSAEPESSAGNGESDQPGPNAPAAGTATYQITGSPQLTADGFDSEVGDAVGPAELAPKSAPEEPKAEEGVAPQVEGGLDPNTERCAEVAAVENGAREVMDVGSAEFDGKPALLAIARSNRSGAVDAYVVTGCPGSGSVVHHDTVTVDR